MASMSHANNKDPRAKLAQELATKDIVGFWTIRAQYENLEPVTPEQPGLWRFEDYKPLADSAGLVIPVEEADRRNLFFSNPGLPGSGLVTDRLFAGVQIINPGEIAKVHRHTGSASRVMLEGAGGYTTVEGEKCVLDRGDVVINPNGAWHENGNEGDRPIMWMDVLDIPFTYKLRANFFDNDYREDNGAGSSVPRQYQSLTRRDGWSAHAYGAGGVRPAYVDHMSGKGYGSPQLLYKYEPTRELLEDLKSEAGSPYDGVIVEYFSPRDGAAVMRTLDVHLQLLRSGERTLERRRSPATVYCCLEGQGSTVAAGKSLRWKRNDILVIPAWCWHHHENASEDSVLYSVSDAPALKALGLYVEERKGPDGSSKRLQI